MAGVAVSVTSPRTLPSLSSTFSCLPLHSVVKCLIADAVAHPHLVPESSGPLCSRPHPRCFAVLSPVTLSITQEVGIKIPFYCRESWDAKGLGSLLEAKELVPGRAEIRPLEGRTCALPSTGCSAATTSFMPDCGPRRHLLCCTLCLESTFNFFF